MLGLLNLKLMCGFLSSLSTCFCGTFHHNSIQSNTSCLKCVHNSYLGIFVCVCLYVSFYHTNPYDCVPVIPVTVRCYENAQPPSCSYQAKIFRGELSLVFKKLWPLVYILPIGSLWTSGQCWMRF